MPRVKIEDLKPPAKDLNVGEMKKLYGGALTFGREKLSSLPNPPKPTLTGDGGIAADDWEFGGG
jgi:hypothetical protein